MKKIILLGLIFISINSTAHYYGSDGLTIGITSGANIGYHNNAGIGAWFDFGQYGIEIGRGTATNRPTSLQPTMHYENIVAYENIKLKTMQMQIGVGGFVCTAFSFISGRIENTISPMVMVGITKDLSYGSRYVFKTNLMAGTIPTLNIGIGMKL